MSVLSTRRSAQPMARPTTRRRRRRAAAERHGRQPASPRRCARAGPSPREDTAQHPHVAVCACSAVGAARRCRARAHARARAPRARVCKRVLAAGRALVPRWLGRRPTASGYSLLDVIDDQDVHRPDRTRASPGLELRADGMAVAPMCNPMLTHAVRTLAAGAEASAGVWGCGA